MRERHREFGQNFENNSAMYKDYCAAVVKEYQHLVASGKVPFNLHPLKPANIKRACIDVYIQRFRREDERILRAFFRYGKDSNDHLSAIELCGTGRFKAIINFVKGRSKETDQKNIELLAWLIDFKDRPFDTQGKYGRVCEDGPNKLSEPSVYETVTPETDVNPNLVDLDRNEPFPLGIPPPIGVPQKPWSRKPALAIVMLFIMMISGYLGVNYPRSNNDITQSDNSCMYWKDDHYEKIPCNQKVQFSRVIALDTNLLNNFTKITNAGTITYNSIGRVWYIKVNGEPEFYTGMGYHPVFTQLQLKPVTEYIIDHYILKNKRPTNNAVGSLLDTKIPVDQEESLKFSSSLKRGIYGQCQALTKKKTRCLRDAKAGGFCWQHTKTRV